MAKVTPDEALARAQRDEKCWRDALALASARAKNLETECAVLRNALRFYADPTGYENASPRHVRAVIADGGTLAREALGEPFDV